MILIEKKRIIIHFSDAMMIEIIDKQSKEEIINKIKKDINIVLINCQIVTIRKLKSKDLIIYVNNLTAKKEMKFIMK